MLDKPSFPYGAGFRSLTHEIAEPVALAVTGALPSWRASPDLTWEWPWRKDRHEIPG